MASCLGSPCVPRAAANASALRSSCPALSGARLALPARLPGRRLAPTAVRAAFSRTKKAKRAPKEKVEKPEEGSEKAAALQRVLDDIDASFGKGTIMRLGDGTVQGVAMHSSGSLSLDLALGGGYPKGRIIEIYGPESAGKTTLALSAMAQVQKNGGNCALIDAEHAFDPDYSAKLGVDVASLIVCQPESGEMGLQVVDTLARSQAVDMICIDSVAALVPRAEIEGEIGDQLVGVQARLMSQALRKLATNASKAGCTVIFLNQLRNKIGVIYGSPEVTSGGNALKFYASQRLDVRRRETIKGGSGSDGHDVGIRVKVTVKKNKVAPPYRIAELDLKFQGGPCKMGSLLDAAESCGIVDRKGAWYGFGETRLGQGREKSVAFLEESPEVAAEIDGLVRTKIFKGGAVVVEGLPVASAYGEDELDEGGEEELGGEEDGWEDVEEGGGMESE